MMALQRDVTWRAGLIEDEAELLYLPDFLSRASSFTIIFFE